MKRDNRGTSIIELMVIIAILAILLGMMLNITGYLNGKQARECAYKVDAALAKIRMETMSKSTGTEDVFLTLKQKDGKLYAVSRIKGEVAEEVVGNGKVSGKAITIDQNTVELDGTHEVSIYFNRATGALSKNQTRYIRLEFTQGTVTYKVEIEPLTGKISYGRM